MKIDYLNADAEIFSHCSGAKIAVVKNNDPIKVFSVSFRTPAFNDAGVPHVLEHLLLCGSEKFPQRDPVAELEKRALFSYLNAITFNDRTVFLCASWDDNSFLEMAEVYLDGIFRPLFLEKTFQEEKNVVLNEINQNTDIEITLINKAKKKLFDKYFVSSGIYEDLKNLKLSDLKEYYKKYYNYDNCFIFLYGNFDEEKINSLLNSYLDIPIHSQSVCFPEYRKTLHEFALETYNNTAVCCFPIDENDIFLFEASKKFNFKIHKEIGYETIVSATSYNCNDAENFKEQVMNFIKSIKTNVSQKELCNYNRLNQIKYSLKDFGYRTVGIVYAINFSFDHSLKNICLCPTDSPFFISMQFNVDGISEEKIRQIAAGLSCEKYNTEVIFHKKTKILDVRFTVFSEEIPEIDISSEFYYKNNFIETKKTHTVLKGSIAPLKHSAAISELLTNNFLIPELRQKLGAYDVGAEIFSDGRFVLFCSEGVETDLIFQVFKKIPEFLRNCNDIQGASVSALRKLDFPKTKYKKFDFEMNLISQNKFYQDYKLYHDENFYITKESLLSFADEFEIVFKNTTSANLVKIFRVPTWEHKGFFDSIEIFQCGKITLSS